MTIAPTELERAALDLKPEQRARRAAILVESLEEVGDVDRETVESHWIAEAEERCAQIDADNVELEPAEDVLEALRNRNR